ncbi:hypothetical protein GCM10010434_026300 [Winogradskya humida]
MRRLLAALTAGLFLCGCSSPSPSPSSAPAPVLPGASAASTGPSLADPSLTGPSVAPVPVETRRVDAGGDALTMAVGPLIRSGDVVVLSIGTTLQSAGSAQVGRQFSASQTTSFDGARLVDTAGRRVYLTAEAGGNCVCTTRVRIGQGETRPLQAAFSGVPATVTSLSVMLPYAGVFADVPVVAGPVPAPPTGPDSLGRTQKPLDLTGAVSVSAALDAYSDRSDVGLRTRSGADGVDLNLDTDVLFKLDSSQLTAQAGKTIAAAVADVKAAGAGPLTVTGHTDDSGSTAHNQTLSKQRAEAVATAITGPLPDATWPKTVAAKGETQPAVPNTDAASRARNRRVTISFQGDGRSAAQRAKATLPKTAGAVGKAAAGVEVSLPLHRGTIRFTPGRARLSGPFLQLDLIATTVGPDKATIHDFLGQGVFTARDEFDPYARYGAAGIRLFDGTTTSYNLDYELHPGDHRCLCDRLLNQPIPPGSSQTLSLWFPAPPPATKSVTLDVPDKLRLTDVPIG